LQDAVAEWDAEAILRVFLALKWESSAKKAAQMPLQGERFFHALIKLTMPGVSLRKDHHLSTKVEVP
jgi:hypothetical protein